MGRKKDEEIGSWRDSEIRESQLQTLLPVPDIDSSFLKALFDRFYRKV
jgi:hypothetical protein